jgi:hypothetical protein
LAVTSGGTVMVCRVQQAGGFAGGWRISGRSRTRVIEAGRRGPADLARGGGALDPVVAVFVVSGDPAELALRQGASSAVFASCATISSRLASRASGPGSGRLYGAFARSRGSGRSAGYSCGTTRRPMNRRFVRSVRRTTPDNRARTG